MKGITDIYNSSAVKHALVELVKSNYPTLKNIINSTNDLDD